MVGSGAGCDELVDHGLGPSFRQPLIRVSITKRVGMPFDAEAGPHVDVDDDLIDLGDRLGRQLCGTTGERDQDGVSLESIEGLGV